MGKLCRIFLLHWQMPITHRGASCAQRIIDKWLNPFCRYTLMGVVLHRHVASTKTGSFGLFDPSDAVLRSYVGAYGPRRLTFEDGQLWYQRQGNPRMRAIPLTETLFGFSEIDYFRIEVVLDPSGRPLKLIGHYDNGDTDESPRSNGA